MSRFFDVVTFVVLSLPECRQENLFFDVETIFIETKCLPTIGHKSVSTFASAAENFIEKKLALQDTSRKFNPVLCLYCYHDRFKKISFVLES